MAIDKQVQQHDGRREQPSKALQTALDVSVVELTISSVMTAPVSIHDITRLSP